MPLQSSRILNRELSLRREVERLQLLRDDLDEWERHDFERNKARIAEIESELTDVGSGLDWTFDGLGIYENSAVVGRVAQLIEPIARSFRSIGNDIVFVEGGGGIDGTSPRKFAEPVLVGTFNGSFGIHLKRAPIDEQIPLGGITLFERTASRLVAIFDAAHTPNAPEAITEQIRGLRKSSLNALQELASQINRSGRSSYLRWPEDSVLEISGSDTGAIIDVIGGTTPIEEERRIRGRLVGGDIDKSTFHIIEGDGRNYVGATEDVTASRLEVINLGSLVDALVIVEIVDSPFLDEPKESYVLREISPVDINDLLR